MNRYRNRLPFIAPLAFSFGIALGVTLFLLACTPDTPASVIPPDPTDPTEPRLDAKALAFEQEILALKARESDPEKVEAASREITLRYAYPAAPERPQASLPADESASPLAKAAMLKWFPSRTVEIKYAAAHAFMLTVPKGYTMTVEAIRVDAGADPVLVGFHSAKAMPMLSDTHFKTKIIGYNDDYGGNINSKILWKNTTVNNHVIFLVSFAAPGTSGRTTLNITLKLGDVLAHSSTRTKWVSGSAAYAGTVPPTKQLCKDHSASRIRLATFGKSSFDLRTTLIAVNPYTMRGGYIRDVNQTLDLDDPMLPKNGGFILGFIEGKGPQPEPPTPGNFQLVYGPNWWQGFLDDQYDCQL